MTEPADDAFLELQREYLAEFPARLDQLRADLAAFRAGLPESVAALKMSLHRLSGSGGSYGFPEMSDIARELEQWIADGPPTSEAGHLQEGIERLAKILHRSRINVALSTEPRLAHSQSVVVLPPSKEIEDGKQ